MAEIKARAPRGLGSRGKKFWHKVMAEIDFNEAETELLVEVCRSLDSLDQLYETVSVHGPMVKGSAGQIVINPAVSEARQQRIVLHRLMAALEIPDEDGIEEGFVSSARTQSARHAANRRWNSRGI